MCPLSVYSYAAGDPKNVRGQMGWQCVQFWQFNLSGAVGIKCTWNGILQGYLMQLVWCNLSTQCTSEISNKFNETDLMTKKMQFKLVKYRVSQLTVKFGTKLKYASLQTKPMKKSQNHKQIWKEKYFLNLYKILEA